MQPGEKSPGGSEGLEVEEELIQKCSGKWALMRPCGTTPVGSTGVRPVLNHLEIMREMTPWVCNCTCRKDEKR